VVARTVIPRIEIHHAEKFELDVSDEDFSEEDEPVATAGSREGSRKTPPPSMRVKKERAKTVVINEPVVIKEYAGGIFRYLREIDGIK
jgi:hypothetical protein